MEFKAGAVKERVRYEYLGEAFLLTVIGRSKKNHILPKSETGKEIKTLDSCSPSCHRSGGGKEEGGELGFGLFSRV